MKFINHHTTAVIIEILFLAVWYISPFIIMNDFVSFMAYGIWFAHELMILGFFIALFYLFTPIVTVLVVNSFISANENKVNEES